MIKIYIVGNQLNYANFIYNHKLVDNMEEADLVIFTGGEDVDPAIYGEKNIYSSINTIRDAKEVSEFLDAMLQDKPCIGICRGAQFVTAANGGKLIQDVDNHAIGGTHSITNTNNQYPAKELEITSTHHQMMYPFNLDYEDYEVVAYSTVNRSTEYLTGFGEYTEDQVPCEPEIVYYPETNSLAIQGHPEYMDKDSEAVKYCNWLINKYLL